MTTTAPAAALVAAVTTTGTRAVAAAVEVVAPGVDRTSTRDGAIRALAGEINKDSGDNKAGDSRDITSKDGGSR